MEKAGLIGLVKLRYIESDDNLALRGDKLKEAIKRDRDNGLIPFYVGLQPDPIYRDYNKTHFSCALPWAPLEHAPLITFRNLDQSARSLPYITNYTFKEYTLILLVILRLIIFQRLTLIF